MSSDPNPEYVEASESLQNNLYYEKSTLDLVISFCKSGRVTSLSFMETLAETVHVMLRMLEMYSKDKTHIFVRRRKAARKKAAKAVEGGAFFLALIVPGNI